MFEALKKNEVQSRWLSTVLTLVFIAGSFVAVYLAVQESQKPPVCANTTKFMRSYTVSNASQCDAAAWAQCAVACPEKCTASSDTEFDTVYASSIWHQQAPWCGDGGITLTSAKAKTDLIANGFTASLAAYATSLANLNGGTGGWPGFPARINRAQTGPAIWAGEISCASTKLDDDCAACCCKDAFISSPERCKATFCEDKGGCASGEVAANMHHPQKVCKTDCEKYYSTTPTICTETSSGVYAEAACTADFLVGHGKGSTQQTGSLRYWSGQKPAYGGLTPVTTQGAQGKCFQKT